MLYYLLLLAAGALQGVMVSLNAQLGKYYSLLAKKTDLRFRGAPWYVYLVGVLGIAIVASSSWCTLRVGASVMLAISTAGQIISSQLIDQFGLLGMPVQKFRARQLPGYVLLAAGVALVVLGT